jgi:thiol:disulfide interchange protein DsbD
VGVGEIVWPLPRRQRLQSLVNYGYSGQVFLPVPIQIPAAAPTGRPLSLRVEANLFVCSDEMCVPRSFRLSLALAVRDGAAPLTREGAAIERVVEAAPRPAPIAAHATVADGVLILTAVGGPLAGVDPGPVWFFPFEPGRIDHAAPQSGFWGPRGLSLTLTPGRAAPTDTPLAGVLHTGAGDFQIAAVAGPPLPGADGRPLRMAPEDEAGPPSGAPVPALWQAALFALAGGLILNLMPCVFPILAMKAAALAGSAHRPAEARRDGLLFLAGVLASFLALAGLLLALRGAGQAVGWGFQLQSPAVVAGLALLMLAVGLNLSGVFHVGGGVQGVGAGPLARLPGGIGAFMTGGLAVVVAAPCTAPFMAAAVGAALVAPWPAALAVFALLGLGLAAPYVAVSFAPALLSRLPRPGAWMERLKALLAFPMYGAALWLAWVASRQAPEALAPLFAAGLLLALGLWLYGAGQAARSAGARGVPHLTAAAVVLVLAGAGAVVAARAPAAPGPGIASSPLPSQPWSVEAVRAAQAAGRPVLVDFTADWCVTCKINERSALASRGVAEALQRTGAVYLVADWTRRDDAIAAELQRHGRSGVPLYLVYTPGATEPRILPQLLTEGVVVEALEDAGRRDD